MIDAGPAEFVQDGKFHVADICLAVAIVSSISFFRDAGMPSKRFSSSWWQSVHIPSIVSMEVETRSNP